MSLTQLLVVLTGRWRSAVFAACVVLAAVAAATAALWILAPRYTASAALVLDVKSPDPIVGATMPGATIPSYMATQVDVLYSERVALRVIDALGLDRDEEFREDWMDETDGRGDFKSWLAERVTRKLDARPGRESNVIGVKYTSTDAKRSADIANAFVDAFVNVTLQLRVEPAREYNTFFDERAQQLRSALEQAQNKLSAYQRQHGILVTDERLDAENQRLAELTSQMVQAQALATESSSRMRESGSPLPEVLNNSVVLQLATERTRAEAQLEQLRSRLGENHPQIVELVARINELKSASRIESRRVIGSINSVDRINQARLAAARQELEQQRAKMLKLKAERDTVAVLMAEVEQAQKAYDLVAARGTQASIESQATQTNVSVLKRATTPPMPSSPNLALNAAGGLLLALLAGVMTALMREMRDRRLRTDDDVRLGLAQPLLGALPVRRPVHRQSLLRRRLTGALPAH
jgi:succinoglycan biosynthesis transport protein ExoP